MCPSRRRTAAPDAAVYFETPDAFRAWLEAHHETAAELWVGFHKRDSGRPSMTWPQSVDEALCFGWIDGLRKSVDATRYKIRFTPRRAASLWSRVNVRRMAELEAAGRVRPGGRRAFVERRGEAVAPYSYEQRELRLDGALEREFRRERQAWTYYQAQPPWYRRTTAHWVTSAKREETRLRRLRQLIADCAAGRWIHGLEGREPKGR